MTAVSPIRLFISYSHKDESLRIALGDHIALLQREGVIAAWHVRLITAGEKWAGQIAEELEAADIILCLVSAGFLASPRRRRCWRPWIKQPGLQTSLQAAKRRCRHDIVWQAGPGWLETVQLWRHPPCGAKSWTSG